MLSVRPCFSLQIFNCIGEKRQKTVDGKSLKSWNYTHELFTVNEEIAFNTVRNLIRNTLLRQYFFKRSCFQIDSFGIQCSELKQ